MSSLFAILLTTRDFQYTSSQHLFAPSANWPDMAGPVFVKKGLLPFVSLKMSRVPSATLWSLTFELASLT